MPGSFLDSNVLLYFASADVGKADRTRALMAAGGVISVQVLNEVAAVSRRKFGLSWDEVTIVLEAVRRAFQVEPMSIETHETGLAIARRYRMGLYDSMLVAAALISGCDTFWSEDMHDGLLVADRLRIRNPFAQC